MSFDSGDAQGSNIKVFFYTDTSATLAFVNNSGSGTDLKLGINMSHYSNITSTDFNGTGASYLDRTIAHEFTHAIMAATIKNYNALPQFIKEGIAELTHGIDDERGSRIWELAGTATDTSRINSALSLTDTGTGSNDAYAGGYMFMRYFAKQAAADTAKTIALGDATVNVSLSGENETYYANLNSASSVERAVNTASDSNFSVGTAKDRSYTLAAGIKQQIYTTDEDWNFRELGGNNTLIAGGGNDYVTLTGSNNLVALGNGENRVSLAGGVQNTITAGDGADSIRVVGANNTIQLGAGADTVTFSNISTSSVNASNYVDAGAGADYLLIYNFNQTVTGGADNDALHIYGNNNSIDGGAGDDDINIYTAYNTVTGGAGKDQYVIWSNNVKELTITDFDITAGEYIYLSNAVNSAYYDSINEAVVFGSNIHVHFDNAANINDFLEMNIYNASSRYTTLEDLMGAKVFDWAKDGDYYFMIEEGAVDITQDALAYDGTKLQSDKKYSKLTLKGNSLTVTGAAQAQITVTPPVATSNYFLTLENNTFTFSGEAVFEGANALRGNFTVTDTFYFIEDDTVKKMTYSGESGSVNVGVGDTMSLYVKANETVSISYDNYTENYIATSSTMTKEEITSTSSTADVTTYRGYNFRFGSNVLSTDFTEINHYFNNYESQTTLLWSGTLTLGADTFTIEKTVDDSGITFIYDSAGENLIGIDNFTEDESLTINNATYTVTGGKIIRTADGEFYNGDWAAFLANVEEEYYWGSVTGWKIDGSAAIYTVEDLDVVTVSGLNLEGAAVIAGAIDGLTVDNQYIYVSDNLIADSTISFEGEGYLLQAAQGSDTSILGSSANDFIEADNLSVADGATYEIYGNGGADTVSANRLEILGGAFSISGNAGNDSVIAENITVEGGSLEISGDTGADSISVSYATVNDGELEISGGDGADNILVLN